MTDIKHNPNPKEIIMVPQLSLWVCLFFLNKAVGTEEQSVAPTRALTQIPFIDLGPCSVYPKRDHLSSIQSHKAFLSLSASLILSFSVCIDIFSLVLLNTCISTQCQPNTHWIVLFHCCIPPQPRPPLAVGLVAGQPCIYCVASPQKEPHLKILNSVTDWC